MSPLPPEAVKKNALSYMSAFPPFLSFHVAQQIIIQGQNLSAGAPHKALLCTPIQHLTNKTNINGLFFNKYMSYINSAGSNRLWR